MNGPISRVARAVAAKQISPTQAVTKALENIESSNPALNFMAWEVRPYR
jgi:Asp-tRNA(Asn)/Glu-tRNA(Gln) amidotransferase A subunit family amidase